MYPRGVYPQAIHRVLHVVRARDAAVHAAADSGHRVTLTLTLTLTPTLTLTQTPTLSLNPKS